MSFGVPVLYLYCKREVKVVMGTEAFTWYYTGTSLRIDYARKFLCLNAHDNVHFENRRCGNAAHHIFGFMIYQEREKDRRAQ